MAREACKIIIDNGVRALVDSIERILIDKDVYEGRLPENVRLALIQRLADTDLSVFEGDTNLMPEGGLTGILLELQKYGLVTEEVWLVYRKPFIVTDSKVKSDKNKNNDNGKDKE